MAVITNESISEGPAPGRLASPAAAVPTVAKMPAPMIAPMPRSVMLNAPSVLFRENCGPPADARMSSRFLVRKIPRSKVLVSRLCKVRVLLEGHARVCLNKMCSCAQHHKVKSEKAKGKSEAANHI